MDNEKYLKIGDFAKLCNVTKDTLFHYERIGILKPEIKTEKGYRIVFYLWLTIHNVSQISRFRHCEELRDAAIQAEILKSAKKVLDCFAAARNDEGF